MALKVDSLPLDCRGEIHQLVLRGVQVNLIFSRKGSLRSGDIHPNDQYDYIIKGRAIIQVGDHIREKHGGNEIRVPANVPHLFTFTEDTWMLEWWDGPFEAEYYEPFRHFVNEYLKAHNGEIP